MFREPKWNNSSKLTIYNDAAKMNITEEFVNDVLEKMTIKRGIV